MPRYLPVRRSSPMELLRGDMRSFLEGWPWHSSEGQTTAGAWFPIDVVETKDDYRVMAEVPGVSSDKVEISIESNVLSVAVKKALPELADGDSVHLRERAFGEFKRSITLPQDVDPEKVTAEQSHGVLEVRLAKKEESKPRAIEITSRD